MGRALATVAEELGCSERTLRRGVNLGLLGARRVAGRQLELSQAERGYLHGHWRLLSELTAALRTERAVRLAVLFGSTATGEDHPLSDVDLLIVQHPSGARARAALKLRLRRALGRPVDVVTLEQARSQASLLADVLREGRVLVDRDDLWPTLLAGREGVSAAGLREEKERSAGARAAVAAARQRLASA